MEETGESVSEENMGQQARAAKKALFVAIREGESVHEHIKAMTELFEALAVIGDPVTEEDRVVHLLASLPDSYDMLVTALEANSEAVPKMEIVTERLLHEERKMNEKGTGDDGRKALSVGHKRGNRKKQPTCYFCKKPGHFKRDCRKLAAQGTRRLTSQSTQQARLM